MANVIFSSCCYNIVYSATSFSGLAGYGVGTVYSISQDTNMPNGCYTIITGVTGTSITFNGNSMGVTGCTSTQCLDCCSNTICLNIQNTTYSGYSGDYNISGAYNLYPYWTGGTSDIGYIQYNGINWCLSDVLGGTCYFFGPNPTTSICPDLDETIMYNGRCTPNPTPYDACGAIDFDVLLECDITPTPTPTPTATPTPTPTPTPTIDLCLGFSVSISVNTTTLTPTPTPTPTPTICVIVNVIPSADTVTYIIDTGNFICTRTKELSECGTFNKYYVTEPIEFNGSGLTTGTTFLAVISDQIKCVTYTQDIFGSTNSILELIVTAYTGDCTVCVTPTPTPTATPTPTPTATPTPTPTPTSYPMGTQFIFTSCTSNSMILQTLTPPLNLCETNVIKDDSGNCWVYVTNVVGYYPTTGFIASNQNVFTATTATTYADCLECLTPTPTPTSVYKEWNVKGEYTMSCPVCELTNFGSPLVMYTSSSVQKLEDGVYVYKDSGLTKPLTVDFIKYGDYVYQVNDITGVITQKCKVNGFCK